jgi:hypothetical protein
MSTHDLRESTSDATVFGMLDLLTLLIARERVRAGIEDPRPEPRPRQRRRLVAARLRTVADRLEGYPPELAGR